MGLDMYLTASLYVGMSEVRILKGKEKVMEGKLPESIRKLVTKKFPEAKGKKVECVEIEAAYWRKSNHIHGWFVSNKQNGIDECQKVEVEIADLKVLVDLCESILARRKESPEAGLELAKEELPVTPGFFFGGDDYGDWYWGDIQHTIDQLKPYTTDPAWEEWTFYYGSSW